MAEAIGVQEEGAGGEERGEDDEKSTMSRKEKRKERKKMKRKQIRKEVAEKEREEEEKRLNDPEEQKRAKEAEEQERERMERDRKEFEERERQWFEAMERMRMEEEQEEEERRKTLEAEEGAYSRLQEDESKEDDEDWIYVEEGPAEIIWQGNEIIVRKKKVRVPKESVDQQKRIEDADRPTSNPLPPQSEAFAEYQNAATVSAQQMLENVAQQVPNFGTEQDKAHCPFHLKTGACRFGDRCSRVHFYPDKACTLLIRNMYNGPGLFSGEDEGLEYMDEEVERSYEEFYEDVHTEFLKYGELVNFKVCKNSSPHLRGNVYVHYKSLDSAVLAFHSINGRYFAGKQVKCEFVNVTRWKVAICGEYMKSRFKTCSRGKACNFIHCFCNPGGDYEWADWDKAAPRYWIKKMAALFSYSVETLYDNEMKQEKSGQLKKSSKTLAESDRYRARRSRSRDIYTPRKSVDKEDDVQEGSHRERHDNSYRKHTKIRNEKMFDRNKSVDHHYGRSKSRARTFDEECSESDGDIDTKKYRNENDERKRLRHQTQVSKHPTDNRRIRNRAHEVDSSEEFSDGGSSKHSYENCTKSSRSHTKRAFIDDGRDDKNGANGYKGGKDRNGEQYHSSKRAKSRHHSDSSSPDETRDGRNTTLGTGSTEKLSYWDKDGDRQHYHTRKNSRNHDIVAELPDELLDCRHSNYDIYSSNDHSDRDKVKLHSHASKRARHNESHVSGNEEATAHLTRSTKKVDKLHHLNVESPGGDLNSRGKSCSIEDNVSESSDQRKGLHSKRTERDAPAECRKNAYEGHSNTDDDDTQYGDKSSSWAKNSDGHHESRSGSDRKHRHRRHSRQIEKDAETKEQLEGNPGELVESRSRSCRQHRQKRHSRQIEKDVETEKQHENSGELIEVRSKRSRRHGHKKHSRQIERDAETKDQREHEEDADDLK